jgi:hypothetical protein
LEHYTMAIEFYIYIFDLYLDVYLSLNMRKVNVKV